MQVMATIDSCLAALLGFSFVTLPRFAMPLAERLLSFQVYSPMLRLHPLSLLIPLKLSALTCNLGMSTMLCEKVAY